MLGHEAEIEDIVHAAGATLDDVRGPVRRRDLVEVRRVVARYLRTSGCSLPEIGRALNRDHSTVMHLLGIRGVRRGGRGA